MKVPCSYRQQSQRRKQRLRWRTPLHRRHCIGSIMMMRIRYDSPPLQWIGSAASKSINERNGWILWEINFHNKIQPVTDVNKVSKLGHHWTVNHPCVKTSWLSSTIINYHQTVNHPCVENKLTIVNHYQTVDHPRVKKDNFQLLSTISSCC